jgi:hypothetical protein
MHDRHRQHQSEQLARRREVLALPMVPLRHHAHLRPSSDESVWHREPRAVGVGSEGDAVVLWDHRSLQVRLLTRHGSHSKVGDGVSLPARPADFVQPLRDGHVLLVDARSRRGGSRGGETAEVWDGEGTWIRSGHLGDAVEHVLTTSGGDIWVGYFDEAAALGRGLGGHGLVRFGADLQPRWLYPFGAGLPRIDDCQALNVSGEVASAFVYNAHHLVSICGDEVTDHGASLHVGANGVLLDGERAVLIGGYSADYDLITPMHLGSDGIQVTGPLARLVLPDGMELRDARLTCRGAELHAMVKGTWYRADLEDFHHA